MVSVEETLIKSYLLLSFVALTSCSFLTTQQLLSKNPEASDSIALGRIKATAIKRIQNQEVCFDIELNCKNVKVEQALASNWNLAWIDRSDHYHLMPTTQRSPGALPKTKTVTTLFKSHTEIHNSFTNCVSTTSLKDVKGIVMTARELPFKNQDELKLHWSHE